MFAPLRSVLATQLMTCDIKATTADVVLSAEHSQFMMNDLLAADVSIDDQMDYQMDYQSGHTAKNCCGNNNACMSDCHFAMSASLFMQRAEYSPAFLNADTFDYDSSALLVRELNPPSRPPLSLNS